uniref:WWE domain-containing protein n=1 Tax=Gongylonema pulchrum TaxID=637853 RepID=A0A183ETF1_9BILA
LCDEVSRLRQRIQTVTEERKSTIQAFLFFWATASVEWVDADVVFARQTCASLPAVAGGQEAAAQALKAAESYVSNSSSSSSLVAATAAAAAATGREGGTVRVTADVDNDESDETITSSGAATPNTSASVTFEYFSRGNPRAVNDSEPGNANKANGRYFQCPEQWESQAERW